MTTREKHLSTPTENGGRFAATQRPDSPASLSRSIESIISGITPTTADHLPAATDPRPTMTAHDDGHGGTTWRGRIPIRHLITWHDTVGDVLRSGRTSNTPDAPIELCLRDDSDAHFEIVDGHHRLADALRAGHTDVDVEIHDYTDDEPYEGDLFNFAALTDQMRAAHT